VTANQPNQRVAALTEVIVVLALFILTRNVAAAVGFRFSGALAVVVSVIAIHGLLRRRGATLAGLGFRRPGSWLKTIGLNILGVVAVAVVFLFVLEPLFDRLGVEPSTRDTFGYLVGNPVALAVSLLVLAWGTAAFGEEILTRGFIFNRLADALGGGQAASLLALTLQAVLFGLAHFSYGLRGILSSGVIALLLGGIYLLGRRNLWSVIPAHGIIDTISLVQTYQGAG
jgi:membrane protease YdiL (CAAX protease family)